MVESLKTVKHWVKNGDDSAAPSVYRELMDDFDDEEFDHEQREDDEITISRQQHHHVDIPTDTVVHVHHIHQV